MHRCYGQRMPHLCHVDCKSCAAKQKLQLSSAHVHTNRRPDQGCPLLRWGLAACPLVRPKFPFPFSSISFVLHHRVRTVVTNYPSEPATAYRYLQSLGESHSNPTWPPARLPCPVIVSRLRFAPCCLLLAEALLTVLDSHRRHPKWLPRCHRQKG